MKMPLLLSIFTLVVFCIEKANASDLESKKTEILDGLRLAMQRVSTGSFKGEGQVERSCCGQPSLKGDVSIFCSFDWPSGLLRFDRIEPFLVENFSQSSAPNTMVKEEAKQEVFEGKLVNTPDRILDWNNNSPRELRIRPNDPHWAGMAMPFDYRCLGLTVQMSLNRRVQFSELYDSLVGWPVPSIERDTENVWKCTWRGGEISKVIWFDELRGFVPIRLEYAEANGANPCKAEVGWTESRGFVVPSSYTVEDHGVSGGGLVAYNYTFSWLSVNEPQDSSLFSPAGIADGKYTSVVDTRADPSFVVEVINDRIAGGGSSLASLPARKNGWVMSIVVVNIVAAVVLVALFLFRRAFHS